jgi:hypothetical protein
LITRTYFISLLPKIKDMKFRKDIEQDLENGVLPKILTNIQIDIPEEDDDNEEEIDKSPEIKDED